MSKQLAISAAVSIFAMAAFALLGTTDHAHMAGAVQSAANQTGAEIEISAPALDRIASALSSIGPFIGD